MKAIILAAGFGRRMRPLTDSVHKTLIDIHGRTIIQRIIDALLHHGIVDIIIVTGYKHDQLCVFVTGRYPDVKFTFIRNERFDHTNNIYSMALAFENTTLDQDVVLIESDLVFEQRVLTRLLQSPYENVALVDHYRSGMDGTVVTVQNDIITSVIPPHLQTEKFDFTDKYKTLNIYKFSAQFCQSSFRKLLTYYATVIDDNCYYELILGILIYMQRETIHAAIIDTEKWAEIDDPNDLEEVKFLFHEDRLQVLNRSFGGYWNYSILDFCFIRNMYFPTSAMISEIKNSLSDLLHNYGSRQEVLNQKLAWFLLYKKELCRVLNGACQIFPILPQIIGDKKVLLPSPSFGEYNRIFTDAATYDDCVGIDRDALLESAIKYDVVVVVNPNNPTGTILETEFLFEFARCNPRKLLIVDESFIEFSDQPSIIQRLESTPLPNVLVVTSLSKSWGVPGIRLGFVYCCSSQINACIDKNIPIWNCNSAAEFLLEIILKHRNSYNASILQTKKDRSQFMALLREVPCIDTVYPSEGNFIMVSLKTTAPEPTEIAQMLLSEQNIFIKDVSGKFNDGKRYLRFAVRLPQENMRLVQSLHQLSPFQIA
ncbi:MAG: aminotransferase class I/II-fold pyridoxal phosphate-dependent enzyme [Chitinivibrionales bacterium]|nr:aminotransferase class I/II-fold pyridoxal phosphate-dependent enzyme [Chitinivibrionales bacterium]